MDNPVVGVRVQVGSRFSSSRRADRFWVHPAFYTLRSEAFSRAVKRPGREADHSPPTTAEVKKMWIYKSTPPYVFMA
jgi:hypothetical protein